MANDRAVAELESFLAERADPAASTFDTLVTDVQWLKPTTANKAKALVRIPPGFHRVSSPANQ
jgi:hypothetical protein